MEILVSDGTNFVPRTPTLDSKKRAFAPLEKGEEYRVRIINDADFDIGVSLLIDGVNMFVDSRDTRKEELIIVRAKSNVTIPGWYIHSGTKKLVDEK